ncbi:MAG: porin [Chitinophagaceae bacterium]|nr:porin [Chitinophagaceae bacterium]
MLSGLLFNAVTAYAQQTDDLISLLGKEKPKKERETNAFKSTRVVNGHSMEFLAPGTMDFRILHRFGQVNNGYSNMFGLDQASMRMGFDFGILQNLMIGFGRSTYKKELDGFIKFAPLRQATGTGSFPFTVALVAGMTYNTSPFTDTSIKNYNTSRIAYYFQAIIGRKFSEVISLQVMPTAVHNNLVLLNSQSNDQYSVGVGGRIKFSKRMAFTVDYFHRITGLEKGVSFNPLSVGIDIETGGHVFQLHFSNSTGMNERAFITETTNRWDKAEIRFGFNLSRVFQIVKKKKHS